MEVLKRFSDGPNGWKFFWKVIPALILFWILEVLYQYYVLVPGDANLAYLRGSALAGASLVSAALLSSVIMKWVPWFAAYWRLRRYLGVMGVLFLSVHIKVVLATVYGWDFKSIFYTWNPIENPALFGVGAFIILAAMALTSTDWAMQKLTPKRWKMLHRLVYFAYAFFVFHFLLLTPDLATLPGVILCVLIAATLCGELYWFLRIAGKKRFMTLGTFVGFLVIMLYSILIYFAFI